MTAKNHPKHEQTLVVIKPDGVQRSLAGEILGRFEQVGLKNISLKNDKSGRNSENDIVQSLW